MKMNIKIINEKSFLYNGHFINIYNLELWMNFEMNRRAIHARSDIQKIKSALICFINKSFSEEEIYKGINESMQNLINMGLPI